MLNTYILRSIAALLSLGGAGAVANAHQLAQVQAFIAKIPVDQVLDAARALVAG